MIPTTMTVNHQDVVSFVEKYASGYVRLSVMRYDNVFFFFFIGLVQINAVK